MGLNHLIGNLLMYGTKINGECQISYKMTKNDNKPVTVFVTDSRVKSSQNICLDAKNMSQLQAKGALLKSITELDGNSSDLSLKDLALYKQHYNNELSIVSNLVGVTDVRYDEKAGVETIVFGNEELRIDFTTTKEMSNVESNHTIWNNVNNGMIAGKNSINTIKKMEGLHLNAYRCPSGVLTIGWGHTQNVKEGQKITLQQAENFLRQDMKKVEDDIKKYVKVKLNQNQFDALVSFVFNVGIGNFKASTLLKKLNSCDFSGAAKEFGRWIKGTNDKGEKIDLPGLVKRRAAETALFRGDFAKLEKQLEKF